MRLVLHEYSQSGNCYKVRLAAALLGKKLERREYNIMEGETRTPEFLRDVNANGRIPVLQAGDRFIPESNAATYFIAERSRLIPADPFDHADMLHWMFWEQYNHEPNIASLRFWIGWLGLEKLTHDQRAQMAHKRQQGDAALKLMDDHLRKREWLVGRSMTLADVCLFAYTHVAGDAEFDLTRYSHLSSWLERTRHEPGFLPLDA